MAKKNHQSGKHERGRRPAGKNKTAGGPGASRETQRVSNPGQSNARVAARGRGSSDAAAAADSPKEGFLQRTMAGVRRLFGGGRKSSAGDSGGSAKGKSSDPSSNKTPPKARAIRREADIPLEQLAATYTPTQTSLKASFRADGADQQRDQEFASGTGDERWNDEDRFTNKSGDPRIGTHKRTYEPGEAHTASPDNE
jgi:hypothetical protein